VTTTPGYQTPREALRDYCKWCVKGSWPEIHACDAPQCPIFPVKGGKTVKGISPLKTIRARCLDCSGFSINEVRDCQFPDCPLFPFRFGKHPGRAGKATGKPFAPTNAASSGLESHEPVETGTDKGSE